MRGGTRATDGQPLIDLSFSPCKDIGRRTFASFPPVVRTEPLQGRSCPRSDDRRDSSGSLYGFPVWEIRSRFARVGEDPCRRQESCAFIVCRRWVPKLARA